MIAANAVFKALPLPEIKVLVRGHTSNREILTLRYYRILRIFLKVGVHFSAELQQALGRLAHLCGQCAEGLD